MRWRPKRRPRTEARSRRKNTLASGKGLTNQGPLQKPGLSGAKSGNAPSAKPNASCDVTSPPLSLRSSRATGYCRGMLMAEKHTTKSSARADADADHSERIAITKNFPALMSGTVAFVGVLISGANIWVAYIGKNKLVGWVELLRNPS